MKSDCTNTAPTWATQFQELFARDGDRIPDDFASVSSLAEQLGIHPRTARERIYKMLREGKVEMKRFKISNGRALVMVNHYRVKPGK